MGYLTQVLSQSPISMQMNVFMKTVEGVCIKMEKGFDWPTSESKGKRWLMSLVSNQETTRNAKLIGRRISKTDWMLLEEKATVAISTGEDTVDIARQCSALLMILCFLIRNHQ